MPHLCEIAVELVASLGREYSRGIGAIVVRRARLCGAARVCLRRCLCTQCHPCVSEVRESVGLRACAQGSQDDCARPCRACRAFCRGALVLGQAEAAVRDEGDVRERRACGSVQSRSWPVRLDVFGILSV